MLSIAISDWRDLVLVVTGILAIVLAVIALVVVVVLLILGRKAMAAVHRLLKTRGVGALERAQKLAERVAERTAKLPGAPGSDAGPGELIATVSEMRSIEPPFRRRIRSWRPF